MIFFFAESEYGDIMLMKRANKLHSTAAKDSLNFKSKGPLSITFALLPLKSLPQGKMGRVPRET